MTEKIELLDSPYAYWTLLVLPSLALASGYLGRMFARKNSAGMSSMAVLLALAAIDVLPVQDQDRTAHIASLKSRE